jgi:ComF family protein
MESERFVQGFGPAEGVFCAPCRLVPPMFEKAVAYGVYEAEMRTMLHLLKFDGMRPLAATLGPLLGETILRLRPMTTDELLVTAVPLFRGKTRSRGFNQSDLLARAALTTVRRRAPEWRMQYLPELLERRRETKSQAGLNPRGRRRNLQGAFGVRNKSFSPGTEVLVIDDIYTTGATARECARVLRKAGAGKVWMATLARAQRPQVALWDAATMREPVGFG